MLSLSERIQEVLEAEARLYPLTDEDRALIDRAKKAVLEYYEAGFHQLASVAQGRKGLYLGLQFDAKVGQFSICAEAFAQGFAAIAKDRLLTIVTARRARNEEGGRVHLVMPCAACRERLLQFNPEVQVIIPFAEKPVKLPIEAIYQFAYATRIRQRPTDEELDRLVADWWQTERDFFPIAKPLQAPSLQDAPMLPTKVQEPSAATRPRLKNALNELLKAIRLKMKLRD